MNDRPSKEAALLRIQAVVLSYNDPPALSRCLESLLALNYQALEVLVVDNGSTVENLRAIREKIRDCRIITYGRNLGFAGGCNVGIAEAMSGGADFILLLNQDTVVGANFVSALVGVARDHPRAAVIGARTLSLPAEGHGPSLLLYAGAWRKWLPLRQRIPGIEQPDRTVSLEPYPTDYVWGHGMLLRSEAIRAVGPFDTRFFMYYEDLDLCRRMVRSGFEVWCAPAAVMWHDVQDGARASRSEYWRWVQKVRSAGIFHRKHFRPVIAPGLTAFTVLADALQLLRSGHWLAARHLLAAYVWSAFSLELAEGDDETN